MHPSRSAAAARQIASAPHAQVRLGPLMERTPGRAEVVIGLIDGPVAIGHQDLAGTRILGSADGPPPGCTSSDSVACVHGTFIAGMLFASRSSATPGICPGCTLVVRPIFGENTTSGPLDLPSATPEDLADAIVSCIRAGARVVNLSVGLTSVSTRGEHRLEEALTLAAKSGVLLVAAAGNQATMGASALTRHPWVLPVVAYGRRGPLGVSNFGASIGRRGLGAPGEAVTSLGPTSRTLSIGGTSVATPFVTGTIALLASLFAEVSAAEIRSAVLAEYAGRRTSVVPPLLDAEAALQVLSARYLRA